MEGREIRLGALTFIAADSAWLQEAPLDIDALSCMCSRRPTAAAVDPVSVGPHIVSPLCLPPAQALRLVETSEVGEARRGSPVGRPASHGNRA